MKLDNTIIITADLGELKIYRVNKKEGMVGNDLKVSYALELVNDAAYLESHQKMSDRMSDSAGNFMGASGEEHNRESEIKKRTLNDIASDIDTAVDALSPSHCYLSFPKESLTQLTELLSNKTTSVIEKSIGSNLVKTNKNEILDHFA